MRSLDAQEYLNTFNNFEAHLASLSSHSLNLERVERLLRALGDPQKNLKFIHVAGTKGKGSTCAFTAYILRAAGYRTGLYTSPHLYHVNERIRVLEAKASATELKQDFYGAISNKELDGLVTKFSQGIDKIRNDKKLGNLTYFEVLTGLALAYFAGRKVDIVVLETGLGGRLDATNAVEALVSGIALVSLDHVAQLGKTIKVIAAEKAAIIKGQSNVVVGQQSPAATAVIQAKCRALKIRPLTVGKDIHFKSSGKTFSITTPYAAYKHLKTGLAGVHQLHNAAMAVAMVESSGMKASAKAVAQGISQARWPGRLEIVYKKPDVAIDCAHNPASAEILVKSVKRLFPSKKLILVLGLSNDKDIKGVCKVLGAAVHQVVTTQSAHPRAYQFIDADAKKMFGRKFMLNAKSVPAAVTIAMRTAGKSGAVVVAGSVFIAAEARALFKR